MLRLTNPQAANQAPMRLSPDQQNQIHHIIHAQLGEDITVALYGSRTDDAKRGGDVDLYIEAPYRVTLMQRVKLKQALEQTLSLPVDLVIRTQGQPLTAFQAIAKGQAQQISNIQRLNLTARTYGATPIKTYRPKQFTTPSRARK